MLSGSHLGGHQSLAIEVCLCLWQILLLSERFHEAFSFIPLRVGRVRAFNVNPSCSGKVSELLAIKRWPIVRFVQFWVAIVDVYGGKGW